MVKEIYRLKVVTDGDEKPAVTAKAVDDKRAAFHLYECMYDFAR